MAKVQRLVGNDLSPKFDIPASATRQRGTVPSASLVPIQFRMPADFADQGTVKVLGSMLRSARAYAKRIEDEAGKQC
jgi:hypothetical protein